MEKSLGDRGEPHSLPDKARVFCVSVAKMIICVAIVRRHTRILFRVGSSPNESAVPRSKIDSEKDEVTTPIDGDAGSLGRRLIFHIVGDSNVLAAKGQTGNMTMLPCCRLNRAFLTPKVSIVFQPVFTAPRSEPVHRSSLVVRAATKVTPVSAYTEA